MGVGLLSAVFVDAAGITVAPLPMQDAFPMAGLQLWVSAERVEQDRGTVTVIKDLSGNGNDARREAPLGAPATNPFLSNDAVSGHPVLRFTGESVAFCFKRISDIRTAFWVVSKDRSAFGKNNEKFVLGDKVSNDFHAGMTDDTILNTSVGPAHLSQYLADGKTWLNGRMIAAAKTPFPKLLGLISIASTGPVRASQLAQDRNFRARCWQGDIAEILLYNVELSDSDRQAVEKYLMRKYGLPLDDAGLAP